jgi:hypothetical protein
MLTFFHFQMSGGKWLPCECSDKKKDVDSFFYERSTFACYFLLRKATPAIDYVFCCVKKLAKLLLDPQVLAGTRKSTCC